MAATGKRKRKAGNMITTEEKIDRIEKGVQMVHDLVVEMRAAAAAEKTICAATHKAVEERLTGLHRVIKGNGQPGLEQKHQLLADNFTKLEARVIAWASVAIVVGQLLAPVFLEYLRKYNVIS